MPKFPISKPEPDTAGRIFGGWNVDNSFSLLFEQMVRQPRPEPERYFVLVIKAENLDAGFFAGSRVVGNAVRDREKEILPEGCRVIRSIEVTKHFAIEEIR